jgi:hypothetical protein
MGSATRPRGATAPTRINPSFITALSFHHLPTPEGAQAAHATALFSFVFSIFDK